MNPYHAIKKILFTFIFICCLANSTFAIDTNTVKFFPLKVENSYTYERIVSVLGFPPSKKKIKAIVQQERIINNKKYYFLNNFPEEYKNKWVRFDTTSGCLFRYDSTNSCERYPYELLLDSFNTVVGDTIRSCNNYLKKCNSQISGVIFKTNSLIYSYQYNFSFPPTGTSSNWKFASNFGLTQLSITNSGGGGSGSINYVLKGCILNGIIYGDTSTVDIITISSEIPSGFKLHQNYPNPFNPVTKIKFDVPNDHSGNIKLVIFDVMGREVEVLFDGRLNTGSYEAEWNASGFTSGIYFYKLVTNDYSQTNRMVLVK